MLACVPFIGGSVAILSKLMSSSTQEGVDHYGKAGGVATEVRAQRSQANLGGGFIELGCVLFHEGIGMA